GLAVPGYAGVPITYPGAGDTLIFVRGHEDEGKTRASIDWTSLARLDGTIVCYAGPDQLPSMLHSLLTHGRSAEEPAVAVYDGTLPTQTTIAGTLGELEKQLRQLNDRRPAVLVVGRVAALREHLRWFDSRPLFGRRVLVTRQRDQAQELVDLLEAAGAAAILAPMIHIAPPDDYGPLDDACTRVAEFDWIVFASANAVEAFLDRLLAGARDLRALSGTKICVVGQATADRLAKYGLKADLVPAEFRAEAVAPAIAEEGPIEGLKVLLPRSDVGREVIAEELRRHGAEVTEVVAYRTVAAESPR